MNALIPTLLTHEPVLKAGFEHAIRIAMHEAMVRSVKPKPEEPDVVAMLVLEGMPYIANTLRAVADTQGIRSTVSSVFCHQKPTVEFNRPHGRCELGDILIVHRHSDFRGRLAHSNALLLRAKMSSGSSYSIPYAEKHQLRLYEKWPRFKYVRSGRRLNERVRDIGPKARHDGAQYLLIDDSALVHHAASGLLGFPSTHCMAVWPAAPVLYPYFSLADELIRFMVGVTGRTFVDDDSKDPTGWSTVVWDLLEHSLSFVFNRKNVGVVANPRFGRSPRSSSITGMNFCMVGDGVVGGGAVEQQQSIFERISGLRDNNRPPNRDDLLEQDADELGGVSLILIETQDVKERWDRLP